MPLRSLIDAVVGLLAPEACASCGGALARDETGKLCSSCVARIPGVPDPWCPLCMVPIQESAAFSIDGLCRRCRPGRRFRKARAAGTFDGLLKELISRHKYDGRQELGAPLGELLLDTARRWLEPNEYGAIVPVPLHRDRLVERGFNQAYQLARPLARAHRLPVVPALERSRATTAQASLEGAARDDNVRDAFHLQPRHRHDVTKRPVLLVDDVLTTGATAEACARVLVAAGATYVDVLTVARTP